ncbi:MAG TPA: sigma 54-interacting transcriptional regulator [Myxococcota bacterium]|nr:sigma 54-interacting transcriptional regulator [Myxococcota bacterium]
MPIKTLLWIGPARGFRAELADDPRIDIAWEARCPDRPPDCDLVVLDTEAPGADRWLARRSPGEPPVLVWTSDADPDPQWLARGAAAVLPASGEHPDLADHFLALCNGASASPPPPPRPAFIAESAGMRAVAALAERAAGSRVAVLLLGETGTGKEVVARAIHAASARAGQPFTAINCAALPDSLLESELFGHARGAYTGAERDRRGAFEEAHKGTLFLDEVGETSGAFQAKLLRVLQDRTVRPLGSTRSREVDVRLIAATHRDLAREVARGRFREDLFFRLHVFPIRIPPLRDRPEDVIALADYFLELHGDREAVPGCTLSPGARRRLLAHRWPGNVRELENAILRALVLAGRGGALGEQHFDPLAAEAPPAELDGLEDTGAETLRQTLARVEASVIRAALDRNAGHRSETARRLGLTREGLYKKMKRFQVR